jgi:hypothetical protein
LRGTVRVTNSSQLHDLANVVKIEGDLQVAPGAPLLVELPHLREVGSLSVFGDDTIFSAENLTDVHGDLMCFGDCRLPSLERAGNVTIAPVNSNRKVELEFRSLRTALDLSVQNGTPGSPYYKSPQLTRLAFPSLWQLRSLKIYGNQELIDLDLSALLEVGDVNVDTNARLNALTLPLANATGDIDIANNAKLRSVALGAIQPNSVDITQNDSLESVSFPAMTSTSTLHLIGAPKLSAFSLPLLVSADEFLYQNASGPEILDLPALQTMETSLVLHSVSGVQQISAPFFTKTGGLTLAITSLELIDLPLGRPPVESPSASPAISTIDIHSNSELARVRFLELRTVGGLAIPGNPKLEQFEAPLLTSAATLDAQACGKLPACDVWQVVEHVSPAIEPGLSGTLCPCAQAECP